MNIQTLIRINHLQVETFLQAGKVQALKVGNGLDKLRHWLTLIFMAGCLLGSLRTAAGGTWSALANPPPAGVNNALLLSDGTVVCGDGGQNWYRLTPDMQGTKYTRCFFLQMC